LLWAFPINPWPIMATFSCFILGERVLFNDSIYD
jgi:hypothetical protein